MKNKEKLVKGYLSKGPELIKSEFKAEVFDKQVRFPKELGVEHPFVFEDCERVYTKFGLLNGAINKIADNIVNDFSVETDNTKIQVTVNDFKKNNNLNIIFREWIKEALVKGNGFIEIDLKERKIRTLNANNMYVLRDKRGNVIGYNMYLGELNRFNPKRIISFKPEQIAHLKINYIANDPYGYGLVMPSERVIENIILTEQDSHKLISRKAGAPIHVKFGQPGEAVNPADIDSMRASLQYMNNRTEWVTDGNCEMKVIDFGEVGKNLSDILAHDILMLASGMDIPEVLLNSGQLNEGIAKVQLEGWQRKILSFQDLIEGIIIDKIFKPLLKLDNLDGDLDFIWNIPGESEKNAKLEKLNMILSNPGASENMKRIIQLEIARLIGVEDSMEYLALPEKGLDEQDYANKQEQVKAETKSIQPTKREQEKELTQPEMPGEKKVLNESAFNMDVQEFVNIKELKGFTYADYLIKILQTLKTDDFQDLKAITEKDVSDGLLSIADIEKLRTILKNGFKNNQKLIEIENNIRRNLNLKDRITETLIIPAENRPELIARTETVRLANIGLVNLYKENNIKEVRWVASLSDRTCPVCEELDGKIYNINELNIGVNQPPKHVNCRCSLIAI